MKLTTYLNDKKNLLLYKKNGFENLIIENCYLSRLSSNSIDKTISLLEECFEHNIMPILNWDTLMNEVQFERSIKILKLIPIELLKIVRVYDKGALHYILNNYKQTKVQLILDSGPHNTFGFEALQNFCNKYGKDKLDRIIFSNQMQKCDIEESIKKIDTNFELLLLGPIQIFYTPRKLFEPFFKKNQNNIINAIADNLEGPQKNFHMTENHNGTFMFNNKDLSLLDHINILKEFKLDSGLVDLRFLEYENLNLIVPILSKYILNQEVPENLETNNFKNLYPKPTTRGFFINNKTDLLFSKLKNNNLVKSENLHIGEVISVIKDKFLIIKIKNPKSSVNLYSKIKISSPEGKEYFIEINELKNSNLESINHAKYNDIILIKYHRKITAKSLVENLPI